MARLITLMAVLLLASPVQADDCTISNARYKQARAPWWLSFKPVPQFAAANQTAAFIIELPNSGVTLEGAVHRPNGFGAPQWSLSGPCSADSAGTCGFIEGENTSIYGDYAEGVGFLDDARGAKAPDEVILPELAAGLWYSSYRQDEFLDEVEPGDAFILVGCD